MPFIPEDVTLFGYISVSMTICLAVFANCGDRVSNHEGLLLKMARDKLLSSVAYQWSHQRTLSAWRAR